MQISLLLDRSRPDTLTAQLAAQMREAIRTGRIAPGARLPSSRRLAEQLGIGRNTVVRAYETLLMESYVESRPASGMYALLPEGPTLPMRPAAAAPPAPGGTWSGASSGTQLGTQVTTLPTRGRLSFDFAPGLPCAALFPLKTWRRLLRDVLTQGGAAHLTQPVDPFGLPALRAAIGIWLAAARGIVAEPARIAITSGTAEGIALACRLHLTPGARVAMESPGCRLAASAFAAAGAEIDPVAVDEEGLLAEELPTRPTALLHVTPAHQYPTGHTLAPARRAQVLAWARRNGCMILEDDRGAAFRYDGATPPALAAGAPDHCLHLGSFSHALGAGLRLGYAVVPARLVDAARQAKALLNGGGPWLEQAVLAEFMRGGGFAGHLLRMRAAYRERRDHLLAALARHFGAVEISGEAAGLHLFWQLPPGVPDAATVEALGRRARVGVWSLQSSPVAGASAGAWMRRGMLLGYAALSPKQIEQGIARLSDAVDEALDLHRIGLGDLLAHRPAVSARAAAAPAALRRGGKPAPRFRQQPALPPPPPRGPASRSSPAQGSQAAMPVVTALYRYPVKGLSPQPVDSVRLAAGQPFPFDRVFALVRPGMPINPEAPVWAKKGLFVMLMLDEALASVRTYLDETTLVLTARDAERVVLTADLSRAADRARAEAFFHRLAPGLPAAPTLVRARAAAWGHGAGPGGAPLAGHFMDKPDNVISLLNLATLRSLESQWGYRIDPLRFRANIVIDGARPWEEFEWVGHDLRLGAARFTVDRRNGRCSATNVDPATGRRDLDIPGALRRAFGHKDLGVYLVARNDAALAVGDALERPGAGRVAPSPEPPPAPPTGAPTGAPTGTPPGTPIGAGPRSFICRGCYFIYDEAEGWPRGGVAPGTAFADLPQTWRCPDCGTDASAFRPH